MRSFKFAIGLSTYTVRFKKRVTLDGDACEGKCDFEKKVIEIDSGLTKDVSFTTYLHEVIHGVLHELGMQEWSENEPFVESMAQNLARAIRALPEEYK